MWQWALGLTGAFMMGAAKGGLPGIGNLTVALYAVTFDARESVGLLLPVLIAADCVAVVLYRRHAEWAYVWRLLPWMVVGVVIGYFTLDRIDSNMVRILIGGILLLMTVVHFSRKWMLRNAEGPDPVPHTLWFRSSTGTMGGFATMVANAAGPVAALYFLAVGLPKMFFVGTTAWTFFILNLFKVPFQVELGLINTASMGVSAMLMPAAVAGVFFGRLVVGYLNQRVFETLIWIFIVVAGVDLLFNISIVQSLINLFSS